MSDTIQKVPPTRSGGRSQNPRRTQTVKIKASWLDERWKSSFKCSLIVHIQVTFLIHIYYLGFMSYVYVICGIIFHIVNRYYIVYSKRNPRFIVSGWEVLPLHLPMAVGVASGSKEHWNEKVEDGKRKPFVTIKPSIWTYAASFKENNAAFYLRPRCIVPCTHCSLFIVFRTVSVLRSAPYRMETIGLGRWHFFFLFLGWNGE